MASPLRHQFAPFLFFGRYRRVLEAGELTGAARLSAYGFHQVLDGTLTCRAGRRQWQLRPGQASILEPGACLTWSGEALFISLAFDLVPGARRVRANGSPMVPRRRGVQPAWREIFDLDLPERVDPELLRAHRLRLHRLASTRVAHPVDLLAAHAELAVFITAYVALLGRQQDFDERLPIGDRGHGRDSRLDDSTRLVERCETLLMRHAASSAGIGHIAGLLGYAPEQLTRIYRHQRGRPPSRFLQDYRVHLACQAMEADPQRSLDDIALGVGLAGANSLNRLFHSVLGCSPQDWRRRQTGVRRARGTDPGDIAD